MQEEESAAVFSTASPVTAPLELVSNPPAAESCEATAEASADQDSSQGNNVQGQGKCDDKIVALWWHNVLALTTMHCTSTVMIMKHPKGSLEKQPLPCPTAIVNYTGGVDLMDQHLSYYSMTASHTLK